MLKVQPSIKFNVTIVTQYVAIENRIYKVIFWGKNVVIVQHTNDPRQMRRSTDRLKNLEIKKIDGWSNGLI